MVDRPDLLAVGLTTLDVGVHPVTHLPAPDESLRVETVRLSPAGTAAGTALVAARLGLSVALASAVGDDAQGTLVRAALSDAGVDVAQLEVAAGLPTSTSVLPIGREGDRRVLHMLGASVRRPLPDPVRAGAVPAAAVHWGAVGFPLLRDDAPGFLRRARDQGSFVTCDLIGPTPETLAELAAILPFVDLFMPSLAEVRFLSGGDDLDAAAARFLKLGARACIFKLGGEGSILIAGDRRIAVPAYALTPVDTTSCGDAYCAGFHAARARGLAEPDAMRFATATAARVAMGVGTTGRLDDFDATLAFANSATVR